MFNSKSVRRGIGVFVLLFVLSVPVSAQEPLDIESYVRIVLRSHPGARQSLGFDAAALAERRATRLFSDPIIEYSRSRASLSDLANARATETGFSATQTLPWPRTRSAGIRAGESAADGLRESGRAVLWDVEVGARQAFTRLGGTRALVEIAKAAEDDARSLQDLVRRRVELGESRESDRLKTNVEWMRQQSALAIAEREAVAAEALVRTLAVEPLPDPLVIRGQAWPPLPAIDEATLKARLDLNPGLRSARADADRQMALLSLARAGRIPNLDVTFFRGREFDKNFTGLSFGVKVPLWNANRGEIARAQAAVSLSIAFAARVRLDVETEIELRRKDVEIAARLAESLDKEILPAATETLRLVRFSYEEGETSLLDLLDAQRTLRETQREATQARLTLALAVAEIQRLVGPDFNPWSVTR